MDIHQLELFLAVMNSPSMTRAAEKVHLSPGANLAGAPLPARESPLRNWRRVHSDINVDRYALASELCPEASSASQR